MPTPKRKRDINNKENLLNFQQPKFEDEIKDTQKKTNPEAMDISPSISKEVCSSKEEEKDIFKIPPPPKSNPTSSIQIEEIPISEDESFSEHSSPPAPPPPPPPPPPRSLNHRMNKKKMRTLKWIPLPESKLKSTIWQDVKLEQVSMENTVFNIQLSELFSVSPQKDEGKSERGIVISHYVPFY